MSASDFLENKVLATALTGGAYTGAATVYAALYSVGPTEGGTTTELSGSGYSRKAVTFSVTGNVATNTADITFGPASANWSTAVGWAIVDASTGGNILFQDTLPSSVTVNSGKSLVFKTGKINISME